MSRRVLAIAAAAAALVGLASWAFVRFVESPDVAPAGTGPASPAADDQPVRRITATLFYVSPDGTRLAPVHREVLFGATPSEQAMRVIEAQLEPAPDGMTSAIPPGVRVRSVFVAGNGDAYADFGNELRLAHPGGSLNEIFTVYTLVHALTENLPAITAVQILIDGHEVDTLAGHVDLRRPLPKANHWLEPPGGPGRTEPLPGAAGAVPR